MTPYYYNKFGELYHGDCLTVLPELSDIFDMVLCDPPYGVTACKWDSPISLSALWPLLCKNTVEDAVIVMTASQPFTSYLIYSNLDMFKYELVWEKTNGSSPLNAPFQPLKVHEAILVFSKKASTFSKKGSMKYYPQKTVGVPYKGGVKTEGHMSFHTEFVGYKFKDNTGERYPRSVLKFTEEKGLHATQKPVTLMEYLINTYTQQGEVVLDFACGSGTTGIAAIKANRKFVLIEKEEKYCEVTATRMEQYLTNNS